MFEEPGGITITSAPIPAWRERESFSMPSAKSHDQQNQRDFERDGHDADGGAQGAVRQVGDDHFVHHEKSSF